MEFSASKIAELLGGTVEGDSEATVNTLAKIEEGKKGALSFLSNPQYNEYLYTTNATIVIVAKDLALEKEIKPTCNLIRVEDPRKAFAQLLELYNSIKNNKTGVEPGAFVHASAKLGNEVYVGANSFIGENTIISDNVKIQPNTYIGDNCTIGEGTIVFAGSKIHTDCVVGKHCTLHSGVVIGGDGFGFAPNSENNYHKVPHIGNVILEDHVEIGSNTTIDRATLGSTIIRKGVKLDNLIQVAHNVEIGENTVIAAQTGIAGSTKIGKDCMIGGQVGIVGHLTIADKVKIAAQSGIGHSITKEGEIVQGSPAFGIGDYKRSYILYRKLPVLNDKISDLEKTVKELKATSKEL